MEFNLRKYHEIGSRALVVSRSGIHARVLCDDLEGDRGEMVAAYLRGVGLVAYDSKGRAVDPDQIESQLYIHDMATEPMQEGVRYRAFGGRPLVDPGTWARYWVENYAEPSPWKCCEDINWDQKPRITHFEIRGKDKMVTLGSKATSAALAGRMTNDQESALQPNVVYEKTPSNVKLLTAKAGAVPVRVYYSNQNVCSEVLTLGISDNELPAEATHFLVRPIHSDCLKWRLVLPVKHTTKKIPVPNHWKVEVVRRNGMVEAGRAFEFSWGHARGSKDQDIVKFTVVSNASPENKATH